jgi:hypothetical protein
VLAMVLFGTGFALSANAPVRARYLVQHRGFARVDRKLGRACASSPGRPRPFELQLIPKMESPFPIRTVTCEQRGITIVSGTYGAFIADITWGFTTSPNPTSPKVASPDSIQLGLERLGGRWSMWSSSSTMFD